jgi:hypothetical protein
MTFNDIKEYTGCTNVGMIDVYRGKAGSVGIDALVSLATVNKMLKAKARAQQPKTSKASKLCICQLKPGDMVTLDAQVPANVAAKMLAAAKRAGIPIRRRTIVPTLVIRALEGRSCLPGMVVR